MSIILPHIEQMPPYPQGVEPPEGSDALKLNLNENPYPPSPQVLQALRSIGEGSLRLYPDARCDELIKALAKQHGVKEEQVFCGNGSSEIISLIISVFVGSHGSFAIPDPSFSQYHSLATVQQARTVCVPTREDFTVDVEMLIESSADVVVLVNPNAPTGLLLPLSEVERISSSFTGLVVIDEAYIDFAEPESSALPLIERYPNVLIIRSFSKAYGLCGARVGYCIADETLITALEKSKVLYNVNAISRKLALAALQDQAHLAQTTAAIRRTRDRFCQELQQLGFDVVPSQTNFILCTPPARLGKTGAYDLYVNLMEHNVYVRYFNHPRLADKLRISIGTDKAMRQVSDTIRRLLA